MMLGKGNENQQQEATILKGEYIKLHPALDFKKGLAWVTVLLPTQTTKGKREMPWVLNSDRKKFLLSKANLERMGFSQIIECEIFDVERWSRQGIDAWLKGETEVCIEKVFNDIAEKLRYYLDYKCRHVYSLIALWIMATYFFPLFGAFPILFLSGMSGSGKTKTMEVVQPLAFNAMFTSNFSDSAFFRTIHTMRSTMLLDEIEQLSKSENSSTLSLILSSFKRGAHTLRARERKQKEGTNYMPEKFEIYSPKVLGNIRGLRDEALKNRCIKIILTPSQRSDQAKRSVFMESKKFKSIRDQLYVLLMAYYQKVPKAIKKIRKMDLGLYGYSLDIWLPILTMAKLIKQDLFNEMLDFALEKTQERKEEANDNNIYFQLFNTLKLLQKNNSLALKRTKTANFYSFETIYEQFILGLGHKIDKIPNWLSKQRIGRILRQLDFGERLTVNKKRGYWLNEEIIKKMADRSGFAL